MIKRSLGLVWLFVLGLALSGCGGGGGFTSGSSSSDDVATTAATITLLSSAPQLRTGDDTGVTITAIVKDSNNNLIEGETVTFTTSTGAIRVTQSATDASGVASAILTSGGDEEIRTATVTALAGGASATLSVPITGTAIEIAGQSTLVLGDSTTLSVRLEDGMGDGIAAETLTVVSAAGNTLSAQTLTTDANGATSLMVTGAAGGDDTITVSALNATTTFAISVSPDDFQFVTPNASAEINLNTNKTVTVQYEQNGAPQALVTVNFTATRGTLSAASALTDANGRASVTITSNNAGFSTITAMVDGGPTSQRQVEFVATTAAMMELQAQYSDVPTGGGESGQTRITATIRDATDNLVKNKQINFVLTDVTGGTISPATAVTNSNGQASTTYTSGATPSSRDGITITATVDEDAAVTDSVSLTSSEQELFISVGTGNDIEELDVTRYNKIWSVYVTDANGNGVSDTDVTLTLLPVSYSKGVWVWDPADEVWEVVYSVENCADEDLDDDGILDPGEDINGNGELTPGNKATVTGRVTTNSDGFATFDISYAQQYAVWVKVNLIAQAQVSGTESKTTATFLLPISGEDINERDVEPPGNPSPFGTGNLCTDTD